MSDSGDVSPAGLHAAMADEIAEVIVGYEDVVEHLTISMLTRGHLLLEGVPGVAKTTLANLVARVCGLSYSRVQMTPDVLPADITGTNVYHEHTGAFELHRGPVFANVVVADEINRATPKTQSALLEAMQERQVTIEGETLSLPEPFMVIATQNPLEEEGVYALPIAQRDRFQFKLTMGMPERGVERELLERFHGDPALGVETVERVIDPADLLAARAVVADVHVAEAVAEYLLDLVTASREHPDVDHGASPRAAIAFQQAAKAKAAIEGREYVVPDDVRDLAGVVLEHRLALTADAELGGVSPDDVVEDVIESVAVPSASPHELARLVED